MKFIADVPNVHKDPVQLKLYRAWKHIQSKLSENNQRYQAQLTICPSWALLSNFMEDISTLDNYNRFKENPTRFKIMLNEKSNHYSINDVHLKELLVKPSKGAYNVTQEEYNSIYNNYQVKYIKYKSLIPLTDYHEIVNYGIGKAAISYNQDKGALFTTFANKVVLNGILDFIRDNKKHLSQRYLESTICQKGHTLTLKDSLVNEHDDLEMSQAIAKLYEFIGVLPQLDSTILKYLLDGYNYKEISELLGMSPVQVRRLSNKLKVKIKGWL